MPVRIAATRYAGCDRRPRVLTVHDTSLPSELSCESAWSKRFMPTPNRFARALVCHTPGLHFIKSSTLSRSIWVITFRSSSLERITLNNQQFQ